MFNYVQRNLWQTNVYLSQKRREAVNPKWDKSECFTKSRDGNGDKLEKPAFKYKPIIKI